MKLRTKNRLAIVGALISFPYLIGRYVTPNILVDIPTYLAKLSQGNATPLDHASTAMNAVVLASGFYLQYRLVTALTQARKQSDKRASVSKLYEQLDGLVASRSLNPQYRKNITSSLLDGAEPHGKTLVSIGGGSGKIENDLTKLGFDTINTDISYESLKRCRKKNPGIECIVADAEHLPFRDGSADVMFSNEAIGNFDAQAVYRDANRILKKDGVLHVSTYSKTRYNQYAVTSWYELYSPEQFAKFAADAGFAQTKSNEFTSFNILLPIPTKMLISVSKK